MRSGITHAMFEDRIGAGRALAEQLREYAGRRDVIVLGLPRGGVPVAAEVAEQLGAPLDIWLVRKLGVPGHSEFAMGAIASGGVVEIDESVVRELRIHSPEILDVVRRESAELARRELAYRRGRAPLQLGGKTLIVVDDGMATGSTMRAVVSALRKHSPAHIIAAAPVASRQACAELERHADACVCVACPESFGAVGRFYGNFAAIGDEAVTECLDRFQRVQDADGTQEGSA